MSPTLRLVLLMGLLATLLLCITVWSWMRLQTHETRLEAAYGDLADVQRMADRIEAMRDRPTVAGSHEIEISKLSQRIEQATKDAQIPDGSLLRIWPEQARRIGDTPYKEKPVQVLLRNIDLRQALTFLHHVSNEPQALKVKTLRIVAPHRHDEDASWTMEVTLTYLIYDPAPAVGVRPSAAALMQHD